jgi:hypothetical protein
MFWELYQYGRIEDASATADAAHSAARANETDVRDLRGIVDRLQRQVERLTLATLAMAQVLRDKLGVKQAEIEAIIRDIDLADGQLDGRLSQPVQVKRCEGCERVNGPQRHTCLYCGKGLPHESILFPPAVN